MLYAACAAHPRHMTCGSRVSTAHVLDTLKSRQQVLRRKVEQETWADGRRCHCNVPHYLLVRCPRQAVQLAPMEKNVRLAAKTTFDLSQVERRGNIGSMG
ncbi:hypothetical protein LZ30DRAFT_110324 [Colletotrichum cereale]|nr:hypothetical protein LZ30DRAFT_110324 [Colletotrichum cereale]